MSGFYDSDINKAIPEDSIEISVERYEELKHGLSQGKSIDIDNDTPVLVTPPPPPVIVPSSITPRQARLALLGAGLLNTVETYINEMPGQEGEAARISFNFATEFLRNDAVLITVATAQGLSPGDIDDLFTTASTL